VPNSILARAEPQTSLRELTALPRPPSWILGGLLLREGQAGRERRGERIRQGRGGDRRGGKGRTPASILLRAPYVLIQPCDPRMQF
jgi:hypothetical protein